MSEGKQPAETSSIPPTEQAYKKKLRSSKKIKDIPPAKDSSLLLFDSKTKQYLRYKVYLDNDLGISSKSQKLLMTSEMDQDCESSDEVIKSGIKMGMKSFEKAVLLCQTPPHK